MDEAKMTPTNIGAETARWDLSFLYSGIDDPQIDADFSKWEEMAQAFSHDFRNQLREKLPEALARYIEMQKLQAKIFEYLFLAKSTALDNPKIAAKLADLEQESAHTSGEYLTFFELELVKLDESILEKFCEENSLVRKHRPWLAQLRIFKDNFLSEEVESALEKRATLGTGAWSEFFDEAESDLLFDFNGQKKNLTEMFHILPTSILREERARALEVINEGLGRHFAKYSAQTLYMVSSSKSVEVKERKYRHPMDYRNKSNNIPDEVVEALHLAVTNTAGPLAKRYYRLKAAHLGLDVLAWSDRLAPLPFADNRIIPFSQATELVLRAYQSFSPTLADIVQSFIENKRIDAPAARGKRSGAFNASMVLPNDEPASLVLLNYLGSNHDVMILAHEVGHAVHGILAGKAQGALMQHVPMAYAETASIFGEKTTFNFIKGELKNAGDKMGLLALVMEKIEDVLNTVVRQISFSNFERRLHGMDPNFTSWEKIKKFSVKELDQLWLEVTKALYGEDGEVFTYENAEHLWASVSHFHSPFYVYSYAFGELLTQSLYAEQARLGNRFEPLYLDLLRAGSTKNAGELLEPFGLDPRHPDFWTHSINISLEEMLKEVEELSARMGVVISN